MKIITGKNSFLSIIADVGPEVFLVGFLVIRKPDVPIKTEGGFFRFQDRDSFVPVRYPDKNLLNQKIELFFCRQEFFLMGMHPWSIVVFLYLPKKSQGLFHSDSPNISITLKSRNYWNHCIAIAKIPAYENCAFLHSTL